MSNKKEMSILNELAHRLTHTNGVQHTLAQVRGMVERKLATANSLAANIYSTPGNQDKLEENTQVVEALELLCNELANVFGIDFGVEPLEDSNTSKSEENGS